MGAAILIIICSSVLGALSLILFNLFLAYPDHQTNWDNLAFHLRLVVGLAAAGIATGIALAILKKTNGRIKTITILSIAIFITTGFLIFGIRSAEKPVSVSNAKPPERYEFSSDWVSENVRHWEQALAPMKGKPSVRALEIGSFEGRSALWFLKNVLTNPTSSITCVDVFDNAVVEARYDKNIALSGFSNKVIKIKARSDDALKRFDSGTYDFIYIDGSHVAKDVLFDAVLGWELLKPDGVVIFDDYEWVGFGPRLGRHKTPKLAIDAFLEVYTPYAEILYKKKPISFAQKTRRRLGRGWEIRPNRT